MNTLDGIDAARADFVWKDGERLIAFGRSALASLPAFLRAAGIERYALLSTQRAIEQFGSIAIGGGDVVASAATRALIPAGGVSDLAAGAAGELGDLPIIAVGGGRVIDTGKAVAAAAGSQVVAIPTTLSGAPMTAVHRLPSGFAGIPRTVRPSIVIADPELMASQPSALRTGSAMNALSHAVESMFVSGSSPIPRGAAARAVNLIYRSLADEELTEAVRRQRLALGAFHAGYAVGSTGYALHHVLCQTIVALGELPHAPVYGALLPFSLEFYKLRDDLIWQLIGEEMGEGDPSMAIARVCAAAGGATSLGALGLAPERIDSIIAAASERRELALTPGGATAEDVRALIESAF